jgi:hypothetical protein
MANYTIDENGSQFVGGFGQSSELSSKAALWSAGA